MINRFYKSFILTSIFFLMSFNNLFSQLIPVKFICVNKNATNIYLAGSFNSWNPANQEYKLQKINNDGLFEITTNLNIGSHAYKFVIDGQWIEDKLNPLDDGSTYKNSQIIVSDPMINYHTPLNFNEFNILKLPTITAQIAKSIHSNLSIDNIQLLINNKSIKLYEKNFNMILNQFNYEIKTEDIIEGENKIEIKVTTDKGTISSIRVIKISSLPKFDILTENIKYPSENINFYGKLHDSNIDSVIIYHNGSKNYAKINSESFFYLPVKLVEGSNSFSVSVYNKFGFTSNEKNIQYSSNRNPSIKINTFINSREITLSAEASSTLNSDLLYYWTQPEGYSAASIFENSINNKEIKLSIPKINGDYFIKLKVVDGYGNYNFSGVIIRSTDYGLEVLKDSKTPEWINKMILYEIGSYGYNYTNSKISGITSKLDHISSLGVNTIWLTPIFEGEGNGYWTKNYFKISPNLGTQEEFRELINQAHKRNIKVILDLVINHSWEMHPFFQDVKNLKSDSKFSNGYLWNGKPGESQHKYYYDWTVLPNFNVNDSFISNYLTEVAEYWVREFDIDGYRCDVAWGIEIRNPMFWKNLRTRLKKIKPTIFLLAEGDVSNSHEGIKMDLFKNKFDAGYDWQFRGWGNSGILAQLNGNYEIDELNKIITKVFEEDKFPMRFVDNHDHPRGAKEFGYKKLKLAESIVFTIGGIPLIYGGDEIGETSQYSVEKWNDTSVLLPFFKKIIEVRKNYIKNNATISKLTNNSPQKVYSCITKSEDNYILTIANFEDNSNSFKIDFNSFEKISAEYEITDFLNNKTFKISHKDLLNYMFTLDNWESKIYKITPLIDFYLRTNTKTFDFDNKENKFTLELTSNTDWEIKIDSDWIESTVLSGNGNQNISLSINKNNSKTSRKSLIEINGFGVAKIFLEINQEGYLKTNEESLENILVFPNPVYDILTINCKNLCNSVRLYDEMGRLVFEEKPTNNNISIKKLKSGVYNLEIESENTIFKQKMVKLE